MSDQTMFALGDTVVVRSSCGAVYVGRLAATDVDAVALEDVHMPEECYDPEFDVERAVVYRPSAIRSLTTRERQFYLPDD